MKKLALYVAMLSALVYASLVMAGLPTSTDAWDTTYETDPDTTDPYSEGPSNMRVMKTITRLRAQTEHFWGSGLDSASTTQDDGRHREGSARVFVDTTPPEVDSDDNTDACLQVDDADSDAHCEQGRVWVDVDGADDIADTFDDYTIYVAEDTDTDGFADSWVQVSRFAAFSQTSPDTDTNQTFSSGVATNVTGLNGITLPNPAHYGAGNVGDRDFRLTLSGLMQNSSTTVVTYANVVIYNGANGTKDDTAIEACSTIVRLDAGSVQANTSTPVVIDCILSPAADASTKIGVVVTDQGGGTSVWVDSANFNPKLIVEEVCGTTCTDDNQS